MAKKDAPKEPKEPVVVNLGAVVYAKLGGFEHKKVSHYFGGVHGYCYDVIKEGKKKLVKNVPTKNGYYTGNPHMDNSVVAIDKYISGYAVGHKSLFDATESVLWSLFDTCTVGNDLNINSLYLITDSHYLHAFLTKPVKDIEKNMKIFKEEITPEQLTRFVSLRNRIIELEGKLVFTLDVNGSVEGGLGNRTATKQSKLAEAFTRGSKKTINLFKILDKKEFEAPEVDFNKIITANRWFINTGGDNVHLETVEGYRRYSFGHIETKKKYYGKLTPDVTFSRLYTKEPIVTLDKLFTYVCEQVPNKEGYLSAGNVDLIKSRDLTFLIDTIPGIPRNNDLIMPHRVGAVDEPVLIEMINPPMMSYVIKERLEVLDNALRLFLHKEERPANLTYIDITDRIYDKTPNKKEEIKVSLAKELTPTLDFLKVMVEHRNAKKPIPITVSFKYDLPERNGLNSVDHPDVKVWVVVDTRLHKGLMFYTIIETPDWIYINTNAVGNLRIISEKELKQPE